MHMLRHSRQCRRVRSTATSSNARFMDSSNGACPNAVWVFERLAALSILGGVIIFQPELRRGLLRLGDSIRLIGPFVQADSPAIDEIVEACASMSDQSHRRTDRHSAPGAADRLHRTRHGAQRRDHPRAARNHLLQRADPATTIHAAVIVVGNRIAAAGCLFPLSPPPPKLSKAMGTRHRAALGMSEEKRRSHDGRQRRNGPHFDRSRRTTHFGFIAG